MTVFTMARDSPAASRIAVPALLQIGIDQEVYERFLHLAGKALPPALRPFDRLLRSPALREKLRDLEERP
jgi:hypothetical protein